MGYFYNGPKAKLTRRLLKKTIPDPESQLWFYLRDRRFHGIKFRRQYSVGRYVVDFYCPKVRLAIEIDGDSHYVADAPEQDKVRQEYIEACGITVARFTNQEITQHVEEVLKEIERVVLPSP